MSVRHIFGDGVFEFTNLIPYKIPLTDVQMLLCPNLPGFTLTIIVSDNFFVNKIYNESFLIFEI